MKDVNLKNKYVVILVAATLSTGCANTNLSKEAQLTAGGALAGAIAGAQVGGVRGAIIGGIIGGVAGNRLGAYFDEEDKKKLALLEAQSLQSGKSTSFISNKSKAKVSITPQETKVEVNPNQTFSLQADVVKQSLEIVSHEDRSAYVDTPVYRDTSEKLVPKIIIKTGEPIWIAANVINKDWGAVIDGSSVVGYVPLKYLNKSIKTQARKAFAKASPPKPAKIPNTVAVKSEPLNLATTSISPTTHAAIQTTSTTVQAMRVCKVNLIKLEPADGASGLTEERKYCKEPPKGWQIIA